MNKDNKLFSFALKEINGERTYIHDCLVLAAGHNQAYKKAFSYCKNWYPNDSPTYHYDKDKKIHYFDNGYIALTINGYIALTIEDLTETTKKDWLEQAYTMALI